ncbi:D-3-phosphoglycerate dehydrogenase [Actinomadura meyerae]|jgi:D-3-phosphoglycerate dehydrogenase|uniref:D-3-phosphoglycerate dehydrogenase n=1 Tax=Actinomadura meyerae TaxID=240840 RepID=A0A239EG85_9ACTN|nr:2-hydroxyacid dehydrogenase [Actinomadura meyerae]SNS43451.1 D-3-phosphoglycerate dehydrogenase [Actinomadura meyerae]
MRVLAAGDRFVLPDLLAGALDAELGRAAEVRRLELPWPEVPFGPVAEVDEASGDEDTMIGALEGMDACVTQMAPVTAKVLDNAPGLRLVAVARGGPVNVDLAAATARGVRVCYAPGRNATATAEYTVGLMLAVLRRIPETHAALAGRREWGGRYYSYEATGLELEGTPVGLIGGGAVGGRVARILAGFGADVRVYDPYLPGGGDIGLEELLRRSRVVSLHARLTAENRGMIGARELALMPPGSVLVNCARGPLVDEDALCDALESGHLMGAGLDTFAVEPPPAGSRLFGLPGVVMTPHLGGASRAVAERAARIVAAEVGRLHRGEPLAHCLNPG